MADTRLVVKLECEDVFFKQKEQEQIRALREKAAKECNKKYCEDHKNHCFRCGSQSLVEVQRGDITIDVCVNDGCGAVHLDPGELEAIMKDQTVIKNVKKSIFDVFK